MSKTKPKAEQSSVPAGPRVVSPQDLVQYFGSTPAWWERHRQRMIDAGLLFKAGKKFIGDLSKIQSAIGEPSFWEGA